MRIKYLLSFMYLGVALMLLVNSSFLVQALGVSPGRTTFTFKPNAVYEGQACYFVSEFPHLKFSMGGPFAQYITIKGLDKNNEMDVTDKQNCITYTVRLPAKAELPGLQRTVINAVEVPPNAGEGIFAVVSIQHQIDIFVPYPYKYLEFGFYVQSVKAGEPVPFTVSVISKGDQNITSAKGIITIYDKNNTHIGKVETQTIYNLNLDESHILNATWDSIGFREGYYSAKLDLLYDGTKDNASVDFKLGGLNVDITNYTKEVAKGGIKEFAIMVESIWAEAIQKVRVIVNVYQNSSSSEPITSFETVSRDLLPWGSDTLTGYLDTEKLNLGEYPIKMKLYFENLTKDYDGKVRIVKESAAAQPPKKINLFTAKNLLILMGVALVIVIIILIYTLIPKKKKQAPVPGSKPK